MTEITVADSEFEDTTILQSSPTSNYVNTTLLTFGRSSGNRNHVIIQLDLAKRPRFIPNLGSETGYVGEAGYTKESAFSTRTQLFVNEGLGYISQIKPSITVDMAGVTYNKANSGLNWTTSGGLDDIVDEPFVDFTFNQTSANQDFDLPFSGRHARRAMFGKINLIYHNNDSNDILALFGSQETGGVGNADVILRGRYATRNRENPIRSRRFGVR
jgi:hypothetical protein